ncbi:MAG: RNA-binding protein [Candidatus Promineifilaceae bacterium]|nr:RNA-binding protein [Candidatus Promineifilaceae bacterium]
MNIYVGNLAWSTTEEELREAFEEYGDVSSVSIITDRDTGRSRGFGFVEMPSDAEARAAIEGLSGAEMGGRTLTVNEARPREDRGGGRSGGGRSGGGRGRGGSGQGRGGQGRGHGQGRRSQSDRGDRR